MKMSAVKRKLKNTKLIQNCQIIRQIEKGIANKEASEKLGVSKNTISTWMKNKDKLFEGLEQSSSDAKKMQGCDYEQVDKAIFKWLSLQRSQNVLIDGPILKEKALQFSKGFNFPTIKAPNGWLDKWAKKVKKQHLLLNKRFSLKFFFYKNLNL